MIKKIPWQSILVSVIVFLFFVNPPGDYDFGWHLRYGEYFWQTGKFLWTNTFSYTMPLFKWVNHSYLYDPFIYSVFKFLGFLGVAVVGATFVYLTLTIIFKAVKALPIEKIAAALLLYYLGVDSLFESIRSRYPSFVFLAALYWLLEKSKKSSKIIYFLPLLFLVWANIHGTFTEGLLYLAGFFIIQIFDLLPKNSKKISFLIKLGAVSLISVGITYFNPFGFAQLIQAFDHATSQYLRLVSEYAPPTLTSEHGIALIIYLAIIAISLFWRRKKEFFLEAVILVPFAYLAFSAIRNIAVFMILSIPLMIKLLRPLSEKLTASRLFARIFPLILLSTFTALIFRLPKYNLFSYTWYDYCRFSSNCSEQAVEYIQANPPTGLGLNNYDWGGLLEWRVPDIKTFIDGRMHLWQSQGIYIMDSYTKLMRTEGDWEQIFRDNNFTWVWLPPKTPIIEKIDTWVQKGTWKKTYDDGISVIYVRQTTAPLSPLPASKQ